MAQMQITLKLLILPSFMLSLSRNSAIGIELAVRLMRTFSEKSNALQYEKNPASNSAANKNETLFIIKVNRSPLSNVI